MRVALVLVVLLSGCSTTAHMICYEAKRVGGTVQIPEQVRCLDNGADDLIVIRTSDKLIGIEKEKEYCDIATTRVGHNPE